MTSDGKSQSTELAAARRVVEAAREWREIIYGATRDLSKAKSELDDAITDYDEIVADRAAGVVDLCGGGDVIIPPMMKEECFTCACERPEWCRENRRCYLYVQPSSRDAASLRADAICQERS